MILPDTNVWLASALSSHGSHSAASDWFSGQRTARSIHFCRATQQSFLRLLTTQKVMQLYGSPPLSNHDAWKLYGEYLADPRVVRRDEPPGLETHWKRLAESAPASPKLWMDAYLAAFAIAGGHTLVTIDAAFRQFDGLRLHLLSGGRARSRLYGVNRAIPGQPE